MFIKKYLKNSYFLSTASVLIFLVVWELAGRFEWIDPLFISYPTKVFLEGWRLMATGELWPHFTASMRAFLAGFGLAVFIGIASGLLVGADTNLYNIFRPYIFALNTLPKVAIVPLIIIWLGIGTWSKIVIVFLMAVPSILINTIDGVGNTNQAFLRMAKSFNADRFFILRSISFFSALPFSFSGMRVAVGKGLIGLIIAEMFGYGKGLGFLISFYGTNFKTSNLIFMIFLLLLISLAAIKLISAAENKIVKINNKF